VYSRRYPDRELTFDFATGLLNDNLLIVDRETHSIWSQLEGKAVSGELKGELLKVIPSIQSTWKFWKDKHPHTRVLYIPNEIGRPYLYSNRKPDIKRTSESSNKHDMSVLGLGLIVDRKAVYFPFNQLEKSNPPFGYKLGNIQLEIHYHKEAMTAWAEDSDGNLLPGVLAYEFGWLDFYPDSEIYNVKTTPHFK